MAMNHLSQDNVWCDKSSYDKAECRHFENLARSVQGSRVPSNSDGPASGSLANEVAKARQRIKQGLQCAIYATNDDYVPSGDLSSRVAQVETENRELRAIVNRLSNSLTEMNEMVEKLSKMVIGKSCPAASDVACPVKPPVKQSTHTKEVDDDDVDLFGSDSEDEDDAAAKIREERLAAYAAKKSKKPVLIAKSNIILDVKPWDDETDMKMLETEVRKIECDGLLWGASKLMPLAYGIHKLQISCVIEDDKVSVDWLSEKIEEITELVQSVDIAAFNKV
ncbi:hypothetical protein PV327_005307 [Microctonus hyperodae]|uniref:Elongation factor 1-delta n=1 Tax=Microctonus hyperodae TaxID=165561 RepID=A0AA39G1V1_MICHY|nr:hypothetical protein PV327_005307 [Microctonus hyperodae]